MCHCSALTQTCLLHSSPPTLISSFVLDYKVNCHMTFFKDLFFYYFRGCVCECVFVEDCLYVHVGSSEGRNCEAPNMVMKSGPSARAADIPNCWAVSPIPHMGFPELCFGSLVKQTSFARVDPLPGMSYVQLITDLGFWKPEILISMSHSFTSHPSSMILAYR